MIVRHFYCFDDFLFLCAVLSMDIIKLLNVLFEAGIAGQTSRELPVLSSVPLLSSYAVPSFLAVIFYGFSPLLCFVAASPQFGGWLLPLGVHINTFLVSFSIIIIITFLQ